MKYQKLYLEQAWEIARTIAAVDKQLLSTGAVEAIAGLAALARKETACKCAEIAKRHDALGSGSDAIRREFNLR